MLKDVADSQRLNTRFYEEEGAVLANEVFYLTIGFGSRSME
jgi:hypothetical protein